MSNAMATMKAVRFHAYGASDVLVYEDAPKPEPAAGEVLVKVHATSVNPIDWKIRAGLMKGLREYPLPFILGWDVSGVVESVGPRSGLDSNRVTKSTAAQIPRVTEPTPSTSR